MLLLSVKNQHQTFSFAVYKSWCNFLKESTAAKHICQNSERYQKAVSKPEIKFFGQ